MAMEVKLSLLPFVLGQLVILGSGSTYCPYYSQDLVRFRAFNMSQVEKVKNLITNYRNLNIKPWMQLAGADTPGLYMAPKDVADYLVAQAREWGMDATILLQNVQHSLLDRPDPSSYYTPYKYAYVDPLVNRTEYLPGSPPESFTSGEYHRYDEITAYLKALADKYDSICQMESIGKSFNGKDIHLLQIGTQTNSTRGIFIDATMHAREWLATSTALYIATQLVTKYHQNPDIQRLVDNITWYIIPVVNVDGYEHTWNLDRTWRRSRSQNLSCIGEQCRCRGVDLNRNWDTQWNTSDACWHLCCNTYPGPAPMSEPEVRHLADKLTSVQDNVQAYISLHTYGQVWMYPFGHKEKAYPKDVADLHEVAELATAALAKLHNTQYKVGQVAETMYAYSGGSPDWVKNYTRIKYSYIIELSPPGFDGQRAGHFCVNFSHIVPTGKEIFEGMKVVAQAVLGELTLTGEAWRRKQDISSGADAGLTSFWTFVCIVSVLAQKLLICTIS